VSVSPELGETTDTLFRAVAAVADALYVVDSGGRIAFLNPAALRILGYTEERELLGKPSHATIHYLRPDGSPFPEEDCPLLGPVRNGETVRIERDWFVRKDGSCVPVAYSSAPVESTGGAVRSLPSAICPSEFGWERWRSRAPESRARPMPLAGRSSAISTMVHSSSSSRSRCSSRTRGV
jgi:PAS domain S-box-containing protein